MNSNDDKEERLFRNLQDAGCPLSVIEQLMKGFVDNDTSLLMSILEQQRRTLLDYLHVQQNKLECLDFLLFQIKKEAGIFHETVKANHLNQKTVKETDNE